MFACIPNRWRFIRCNNASYTLPRIRSSNHDTPFGFSYGIFTFVKYCSSGHQTRKSPCRIRRRWPSYSVEIGWFWFGLWSNRAINSSLRNANICSAGNSHGNWLWSQGENGIFFIKSVWTFKNIFFSKSIQIDVWAAGIILYILLCGFPPFVSPDNEQEPLFDAILSGVYEFPEPYWSDVGQSVRDLIANMLQLDPELRFSSEDVLDHFWTINSASISKLDQLIDLS